MTLSADDVRLLPLSLRRELIAAGHTDRSLARGLRTGALARPRRGAYVDGHMWAGLTDEERYAVRARAAYRQAGTDVVLSHASALPFLDAPLWGHDLADVHLTRRDGRTGRREAGIRQHRGRLVDGDIVEANGLLVSSPVRATLEVATLVSVEASLAVANHFLHRGALTIEQLHGRYESPLLHWPASLGTTLMLRLADPRIESVGESRTAYFLWRSCLPKPVPQFEVFDGHVLVGRLDFAFPDLGIWLEFDGRVKYERFRRPGEAIVDVVLREKRRQDRIEEITGWRCLRIVWADLARPAALERRILQLVDDVARTRGVRRDQA
ncbi:hypothetical protein JK386_02720 [Nocardioides sp. zg-536]|uniref:Type IV toxin-antitoxin system AbiEi family antitoxin domain-containing protein n=1 Tax=Nocardioides faecalis TaxID=2803858 RepID=A0A939BXG6_9ACTN|nr:hypothetical protein [Nocardioides faecalis]MBM9458800.1 hypothetical protein [Nocardioides faecalis]QVI60215.1 hypothetical protein KG111_07980 [Nocardioides faecalis]